MVNAPSRLRGWRHWVAGGAIGAQVVAAGAEPVEVASAPLAAYSLVDVGVREAAMAVSHHTGVAMALEGAIKGPVTLVSGRELDRREAMVLLVNALEAQGWQADLDDQCRLSIRVRQTLLHELQRRARMYRVSGMSATQAAAQVRPLLSPQGELGVADNERLLVVDTARAHLRIHLMPLGDGQAGTSIGGCGLQSRPANPPSPTQDAGSPRLRISLSLQP